MMLAVIALVAPSRGLGQAAGAPPADSTYQRQLEEYNRSLREYDRRRDEFERERGEFERSMKAFQADREQHQAAEAARLASIAESHRQYAASLVDYERRLTASEAEARAPNPRSPPQTDLIAEIGRRKATLRAEAERFHTQLVNEGRDAQGRGDESTARLRFTLATELLRDMGMAPASGATIPGPAMPAFDADDPAVPEVLRVGVRMLQRGSFHLAAVAFGEQLRSAGGGDPRAGPLRELANHLDGWQKRLAAAGPADRRAECVAMERDVSRRWPEGRHATAAGVQVDLELLRKFCK